jgi:hypothetical protein
VSDSSCLLTWCLLSRAHVCNDGTPAIAVLRCHIIITQTASINLAMLRSIISPHDAPAFEDLNHYSTVNPAKGNLASEKRENRRLESLGRSKKRTQSNY